MMVFFGTSKNSLKFLETIIKNGLKIDMIVSAPPKPIGREQTLTENPVVSFAKANKIPFHTAFSFVVNALKPKDNNLGLIFDYNRIIPKEIIDLFPEGIINIHFSKLPQYRGPAPVQATILNGDPTAWITYMLIDEKMDEGKILIQTSLSLDQKETTRSLTEKLLLKTLSEIQKIITDYLEGIIKPAEQIGESSYAKKMETEDVKIDWRKNPLEIERLIRAAFPNPGVWTEIKLKTQDEKLTRLKILKAHLEKEKLILDEVQLEGKNPVTWQQFVEGHSEFSFLSKA